jgi:hypothetical protein
MGWMVNVTPQQLYPREIHGIHCIGGWVDRRVGLGGYAKPRPPPRFDPRPVEPVASRYTGPHIYIYIYIWTVLIFNWRIIYTTTVKLLYNFLPSCKANKFNTRKHISKGLEFWYFYVLQTGQVGCGFLQASYLMGTGVLSRG